jgi:uncharacterized protein (DUF885 family)
LGRADLAYAEPEPAEPNARLDRLLREDLDAELAASPTTATWLGVHGFDDRLDDVRADAQAREVARWRGLAERLRALTPSPATKLDAQHQIDRRLLEARAQVALFDLTELRTRERNPLTYVDLAAAGIEPLVALEATPFAERLRSIDARLWKIRPLFDEARRNLRATAPDLLIRRAIDSAQAQKEFLAETLPKAVQSVSDPRLIEDFRAADRDAVSALEDFAGWLQRDLAPRAKGDLPLGRERFLERLRLSDGIDTTPEALLQVGERELKEARRRFDEAARPLLAARPVTDIGKILEEDHSRPEELLDRAQAVSDSLFKFLSDGGLLPVPDERPKVAELPPALWGFVRLAMNAPLEARPREPVLWIDPVDRRWPDRKKQEHLRAFNRPLMVVALIHQLAGHYIQGVLDRAAPTTAQKIALSPVFLEGWAHYVERMIVDEGFLAGDVKVRLAMERSMMLHAARLVAAVRLHAMGAKLDEVAAQLVAEAGLDEGQARREAERAAADPWTIAETLGRVELEKLRADYRAQNPSTTLGSFHAALLHHGSPPVTELRRQLLPNDTSSPF